MFEISGKYGTAKCYATNIEDECIEQIKTMMDTAFAENSNTTIMPDAHLGKGCTIGTTMRITNKVVPNIVGVDISCGMLAADLGYKDINLAEFDDACHKIPSGKGSVWGGRKERFDLTRLKCYRDLKDTKRIERSLGSLGSGNHFIEIDRASNGMNRLVIHSGSRNLGKQVAEYYQNIAIDLHSGKEEYFKERDELIDSYKKQGRRTEIQDALKKLNKEWSNRVDAPDVPKDLCWLYGQYMEDYLHDIKICHEFAHRNRERMMIEILSMMHMDASSVFHTVHNYIDTDEMVLRKGAIAAHKNEVILIPLNMRDGSILAKGKGNEVWNNSGPHGAGRVMSRSKARESLSMDTYKNDMKGIYTTSVCEDTIDEAPEAYKSMEDILKPISESVEIVDVMKPIYNFKAS